MKSIYHSTLMVILVLVSGALTAQSTAVERYFKDFRLDDQYTHVSVSSKMFDLFVNFEREDATEQKIIETISKLKGLKVLVGKEIENANDVFQQIVTRPYADMEELMDIQESGRAFRFFITEANGRINELAMVGYEGQQVFILSLIGDIDLKEISELSENMDIDGFEHFKNIKQ